MTEKNVLEDDGSMILSYRGEIPCWYRQDIRGSVTNIVDGSGAVKKSYTYDAYGNTTASADVFENHHAYTGAYMDGETGLYYLSSRYYDPKTGSFTSADSYRGEGEGYWELYAYCEGDPVNYVDITGEKRIWIKYNKKKLYIYRNTCGLNFRYFNESITTKKVKKEIYDMSFLKNTIRYSAIRTISFNQLRRSKKFGSKYGYRMGVKRDKYRTLESTQTDWAFSNEEYLNSNKNINISTFIPGFSHRYIIDLAQSFLIDALTSQKQGKYVNYAGWYKKFEWIVQFSSSKRIYVMTYLRNPGGPKNKGSAVYTEIY